jgi:hypothetical protein
MSYKVFFEDQSSISGKEYFYTESTFGSDQLSKVIIFKNSFSHVGEEDFIRIVTRNGEIELLGNDDRIERHDEFTIINLGKCKYISCFIYSLPKFSMSIESIKEYYEPKNILLMTSQRIEIPNVKIKFAEGRYKWSKIVLEKKKIHLLVEGIKN